MMTDSTLDDGIYELPKGHVVEITTFFQMCDRPSLPDQEDTLITLEPWSNPDPDAYLDLFNAVGADWLWLSRRLMARDELAQVLNEDKRIVHRAFQEGQVIGLVELKFTASGDCELAFFGLVAGATGRGTGRVMMHAALRRAWSEATTKRVWLHTCTFDHPAAVRFYSSFGFKPFRRTIRVQADPRIAIDQLRHASPQMPIIYPE